MTVTVDHEPLPVRELKLETVGQVLNHLVRENKLVVQVLLDGQAPRPGELGILRQTRLDGHTLFIETADPRALALEVLDEVVQQINESELAKCEAAELLQKNQLSKAMEKLGVTLRAWQHAQESVEKITELLRLDLEMLTVDGLSMREMLENFSIQLRSIRSALEQRDFVSLGDVLMYETNDTSHQWLSAVETLAHTIESLGQPVAS